MVKPLLRPPKHTKDSKSSRPSCSRLARNHTIAWKVSCTACPVALCSGHLPKTSPKTT